MIIRVTSLLAMIVLLPSTIFTDPIPATVVKVVDGDTVVVNVDSWKNTPFNIQSLRISGIDTPEDRKPPAKCVAETKLGKAAQTYAKTLVKPGDQITFIFHSIDKYGGRIDADLYLPDGRNWSNIMLTQGYAHAYDGGTKTTWCKPRTHKSAPTSN